MIKRLQPETIIFYGNIPAECKGNIVRIKATTDDLKKAETAVLRMSNDKYRKAIFNAQVYANSGAGTYEKAVDMAVRDMLKAGLNCVEYKNGARHTLADYADMAIRTANKRAYLMGEGEKRKEWGISLVVVNSRRGGCSDCAQYIGKVFIDDVYSGGKPTDGNYPLLSDAIEDGLFHPRCKDSTSTYYEGITTLKPVTPDEMAEMEKREKLEQQHSYYQNQANKNQRVADYSLDDENYRIYQHRAKQSQKKADELGKKLDETIAKSGGSGIMNTGATSGALNPYSKKASEHAIRYYEAVRHMTTDTSKISIATNIKKDKLDKIKNHIFIKEHDLLDGHKRFTPSYDMAQSWQRLISGKYEKKDIVLLKHEYSEIRYMEKGLSQNDAHIMASKRYNYAKYCE